MSFLAPPTVEQYLKNVNEEPHRIPTLL